MSARGSVSVIVPVRDGERFLPAALESILADEPVPAEVIVVDDGSTDRSAALARDHGNGVIVLRQPAQGVSAARNAGIAAAKGEWIAFLDADDLWCPGRMACQGALLAGDPTLDLVLGRTQLVREEGAGYVARGEPWPALSAGALMVRRQALARVGGFDPAKAMSEDVDWILRAREAGLRMQLHPEVVQLYRRHEGNATNERVANQRGFLSALRDAIGRRRQEQISVILAVRNGETYLEQALASIEAQTLAPQEIVVVDGGSSDRSAEIAGAHPLVRIVAQQGRGIADAYNLGIREARCPLIAFLSCDDRWLPTKLERQAAWLRENPEQRYVVGHALFELEAGCTLPTGFRPELLGTSRPAWIMETLLARREVFGEVGEFDVAFSVAEDVDWFSRARELGVPSGVLAETVVRKRVHGGNASLAPDHARSLLAVLRKAAHRKRGGNA